jgi:hypothetical protein
VPIGIEVLFYLPCLVDVEIEGRDFERAEREAYLVRLRLQLLYLFAEEIRSHATVDTPGHLQRGGVGVAVPLHEPNYEWEAYRRQGVVAELISGIGSVPI